MTWLCFENEIQIFRTAQVLFVFVWGRKVIHAEQQTGRTCSKNLQDQLVFFLFYLYLSIFLREIMLSK